MYIFLVLYFLETKCWDSYLGRYLSFLNWVVWTKKQENCYYIPIVKFVDYICPAEMEAKFNSSHRNYQRRKAWIADYIKDSPKQVLL